MLFLQELRPGTHIVPSGQLKETFLVHHTLVMIRTNILPDIHAGIIQKQTNPTALIKMSRKVQNFLDQFRLVLLCDSQFIQLQSLIQAIQFILQSAVLLSVLLFHRPGYYHYCWSAVICHRLFTHTEETSIFLIQHFLSQITIIFFLFHAVTGYFPHIPCKYLTVFTSKIIINTGQLLCRRIHKIYFLAFRIHQIHDLLQLIQDFVVLKLF